LDFSLSATALLQLLPLPIHVLVSLENEERKVKNRRKMKDMKFYDGNGGIQEHNATENQVLY
jgi:hypothetical protein